MSIIKEHLHIELKKEDIERAHRVGKNDSDGKQLRAIIIKFVSYRTRMQVFQHKKQLKRSGLVIKEDFTKVRQTLLCKAVGKLGATNVWTHDGKIPFKTKDKPDKIQTADLKDLLSW